MAESPPTKLRLTIVSETLDEQGREDAARRLRDELLQAGVEVGTPASSAELPKGAKGLPFDLSVVEVSMAAAPVIIPRLIDFVRGWLSSRRDPERLRISVHDTRVEVHGEMDRAELDNVVHMLSTAAETAPTPQQPAP